MTSSPGEHETSAQIEISVVLPAHNEVGLLSSTVLNIADALQHRKLSFEIVVVENGSLDGTQALAYLLADTWPELRVIELAKADYGSALAEGFARAIGSVLVGFDVDYYDLDFLDKALEHIASDGASIVLASKRAPGAADHRPALRRLLTDLFSRIVHAAIDLGVSDAHGMKVMNREAIADLIPQCQLRGSLFDVELVTRAYRAGLRIVELPATVIERRPPRTSVLKRAIEGLLGVAQLRLVLGESAARPSALAGIARRQSVRALGWFRSKL